jgi:outer membrane protein OmpA-like peptidoglycan-associated protein
MFGVSGEEKTEVKGMIVSRTGETLIVKNKGEKTTVVLTDDTKTKDNKGLLGMRKDYMANTVLIPGLKVKVSGVSDEEGRVVAKTITVDGDDLETAEMIQAGLHPTAEQVASNEQAISANKQNIAANQQQIQQNMSEIKENTDRFSQLSDYDVKADATVTFAVGSSKITPADMTKLKQLAQTATGLKGYIVEVKGYTDASGSAAMNQKLSEDRADAVIAFLIQQGNVPVRHVVAPGAMGEYQPTASNETQQGRAENRRVEVKVLTNKVIAGD